MLPGDVTNQASDCKMKGGIPSIPDATPAFAKLSPSQRLKYFLDPFEARFEDLTKGN